MGRLLGRLIVVPLGFLIGLVAAFLVLALIAQERIVTVLRGVSDRGDWIGELPGLPHVIAIASALLSVRTLLLPLLVVIAGEIGRVRSAAYYTAGMGVAFALLPVVVLTDVAVLGPGNGNPAVAQGALAAFWPVFATAGFAGGLIYWLLAGRKA